MLYTQEQFSIPPQHCLKEKYAGNGLRPRVLVLVKRRNSLLYLDDKVQVEIPQTELAHGETVTGATERVLHSLGYNYQEGQNNFVGYCSLGRERLPHLFMVHFTSKSSRSMRSDIAWTDPVTEVVNHCLFGVVSQHLLSLFAKLKPQDCLGWDERGRGLIIWPCEDDVVQTESNQPAMAEAVAA